MQSIRKVAIAAFLLATCIAARVTAQAQPQTPAPQTPAPQTPAPQTPAPQTPAGQGGRGGRGQIATFPAQQRPPGDPAAIARGKSLFEVNCRLCHGGDLRGGDMGGVN